MVISTADDGWCTARLKGKEKVSDWNTCTHNILYSMKFSSAKNFVKCYRQAVRQEFIFVKRRSLLVCSSIVWSLLVCFSLIFTFVNIYYHTCGFAKKKVVRNLINPLSTGQSKIGRRRPIRLDYHCVNIFQRIFINKVSLERSFHYLNADTLVLKIGQEMTPLQPFEVTQLINFALDRSTSVTCGCDFAHSIAMVTWNV